MLGQSGHFLFQMMLFWTLGSEHFGRIGLAHVLFQSIIFIADLGYSTFFLRIPVSSANWLSAWRVSLGLRLLAILILYSSSVLFWHFRYGADDFAFEYLLWCGLPALFATWNISSSLLADRKTILAFIVQQMPWIVVCLSFYFLFYLPGGDPGKIIKYASFSLGLGFFIQFLFCIKHSSSWLFLLPSFKFRNDRLLQSSVYLSIPSLLGVINERLTAFFLELLAPWFLSAFLLVTQLLSGISGALTQLNRVVISKFTGYISLSTHYSLWQQHFFLIVALTLFFVAVVAFFFPPFGNDVWKMQLLLIAYWVLAYFGGGVSAVMLANHQDRDLFRLVILGFGISMPLQLLAFHLESPIFLMVARVIGTLWMLYFGCKHAQLHGKWYGVGLSFIFCILVFSNNNYLILLTALACAVFAFFCIREIKLIKQKLNVN